MSCLGTHDQFLIGKQIYHRHRQLWLLSCRKSKAACKSSANKLNVSQLQKGKAGCAAELPTLSSFGLRWNDAAAVPGVSCAATAAQPQKQQGNSLKPGLPDISELSPHLQQEWHPGNNVVLGSSKIKPYSNLKVMWSCLNCPAGHPHIWTTRVALRTVGSRCPYCEGRRLCKHSSLATKAPRQVKFWNQDKNAKTPEQMLAGSDLRAEWKCPICSHEWQAQVAQRVVNDRGSPRCKSKAVGRKNTHPTFEAAQHQLLLEWDYERNDADGIHPNTTTLGSQKLVHWVCHNCPKGQLHQYQMRASDRTGTHLQGCPYCSGHQVCKCNSLQTRYPMIASEWDLPRNVLIPAQVTSRCKSVGWWENPVRGSWMQKISDRTDPRLNPK
ncbi:TPA: hypothetical protein ACH3X2_000622 [Trebouxia sp. C0005]